MKNKINVLTLGIFAFFLLLFGSKVYAYKAYNVGDQVSYNNVDYYVIADSGASESTVTLLKAEPLSVEEVNTYGGVGTANNHVNMYNCSESDDCYQTANNSGYGGMAYYSSANCGYGQDSNQTDSGCTTDYAQSEVKYVVDAWKTAKASAVTEARLITFDEVKNLGYEWGSWGVSDEGWIATEDTPTWLYNNNYWYWTMSQYNDLASDVWTVNYDGGLYGNSVYSSYSSIGVVRPVIVLSKSVIEDTPDSSSNQSNSSTDSTSNTVVDVPNTSLITSVIVIVLGFAIAACGIVVFYKIINKKGHSK